MSQTLIVVRDPDYDNEYVHLGDSPPAIVTIDLGRAFDGRPEDQEGFDEFAANVLGDARNAGEPQAVAWCAGYLTELARNWGYDIPDLSGALGDEARGGRA